MLKLGAYNIHRDSLRLFWLILLNNLRTKFFGVPKRKRKGLIAMAKEVLKENSTKNLVFAGRGHFRLMWISDFSVALKGLSKILPSAQIERILQFVIDQSIKHGYVTTSFSFWRALDLPYSRGDSFPWLMYAVKQYTLLSKQRRFLRVNRDKLQQLLTSYQKHFLGKNGLVKLTATGDWADTIKRPSSTWNNLLSLYVAKNTQSLGLTSLIDWRVCQKAILATRFNKKFLTDYAGSTMPSVDAPILALYLGLFAKSVRVKLANWLDSQSNLLSASSPARAAVSDYPKNITPLGTRMFCFGYHSRAHWLHLGLMWANGLKSMNKDYKELKRSVEKSVKRYRNFVEVVDLKGNLFRKFLSSDHGFTMSAGQYLELVTKK